MWVICIVSTFIYIFEQVPYEQRGFIHDEIEKKEVHIATVCKATEREDFFNQAFDAICKQTYPDQAVNCVAKKSYSSVYQKTPIELKMAVK